LENFLQNFATIFCRLVHLVLQTLALQRRQGLQGDRSVVDGPVEPVPLLQTVEHRVAQVLLG